jgi:hypothetical protein
MIRTYPKVSKAKARYTPHGTVREHCGICANYLPPQDCKRVLGGVVRGGWCRFFLHKLLKV